MYEDLSTKQESIIEFIKQELYSKGYPPSVREICLAVGLKSTSTVHGHLEKLERKGYIRRDPTKPRAIEIIDHNPFYSEKEIVKVPIVGKVTAGQPILAVENIEDSFPLPLDFVNNNSQCFILTIRGSSMINAGILNEDLVVVQKQDTARDNDIVVALIDDDEATVKRFFKEDDCIRLQPENPTMEPIYRKNVKILGRVTGVIRKL